MTRLTLLLMACLILTACDPQPPERDLTATPPPTRVVEETVFPESTGTSARLTEVFPEATETTTPIPLPSPTLHSSPTPTSEKTPAGPFQIVSPSDGLPPGKIRNLWVASEGQLWVATEVGIYLHRNEEWLTVYEGPVEILLGADDSGRVWAILEEGMAIAAYEPAGEWTVYRSEQGWEVPSPVTYLSPGYGDGFITDPQGRLWLATGRDDLRRFDPASQTWARLHATEIGFAPPEEADYQGHFLTDVELSLNQKVWVGDCMGMGEVLLGHGIRWSDGERWFAAPDTEGECVFDIEIDHDGRIWVGGFDALLTYDPGNGRWSRTPLPPWERTQLVTQIDLDDAGNPWLEILRYGGASPFGEIARFHFIGGAWVEDFRGNFSSLAFGEAGVTWLCSGGDVYRLENGQQARLGRVASNTCQILVDGQGRVWIAGSENLWWMDP